MTDFSPYQCQRTHYISNSPQHFGTAGATLSTDWNNPRSSRKAIPPAYKPSDWICCFKTNPWFILWICYNEMIKASSNWSTPSNLCTILLSNYTLNRIFTISTFTIVLAIVFLKKPINNGVWDGFVFLTMFSATWVLRTPLQSVWL